MPINFLDDACKTVSSNVTFGLCDDPPPATNPAYIEENTPADWIATVNNPRGIEANFHAIDHCVTVLRADGNMESRCDGVLHHESNLTFVELKDRGYRGWLSKGREQLSITYSLFNVDHDVSNFGNIEAYIANKQRPLAHAGHFQEIQQFKDDTGLTLKVQSTIDI